MAKDVFSSAALLIFTHIRVLFTFVVNTDSGQSSDVGVELTADSLPDKLKTFYAHFDLLNDVTSHMIGALLLI